MLYKSFYHMTMLVSDLIYPLHISLYDTRVKYHDRSTIFVFIPNVYKLAENVYSVNTNVTIDG